MTDERPSQVRFHYIKSSLYRTAHVDGAWGGGTPGGLIAMTVYSERFPIPQVLVKALSDTKLGDEVPGTRVAKEGVIREVEATLTMTLPVARAMRTWLDERIKNVEENSANRSEDSE